MADLTGDLAPERIDEPAESFGIGGQIEKSIVARPSDRRTREHRLEQRAQLVARLADLGCSVSHAYILPRGSDIERR
jgi:hypothetical protein